MFKRPSTHYGKAPEPETPYQRAAQVWDDRIGASRIQAKNWRLMAFGSLILTAGFATALVVRLPELGIGDGAKLTALAGLRDEEGRPLADAVDTYRALAAATVDRREATGRLREDQVRALRDALDD